MKQKPKKGEARTSSNAKETGRNCLTLFVVLGGLLHGVHDNLQEQGTGEPQTRVGRLEPPETEELPPEREATRPQQRRPRARSLVSQGFVEPGVAVAEKHMHINTVLPSQTVI